MTERPADSIDLDCVHSGESALPLSAPMVYRQLQNTVQRFQYQAKMTRRAEILQYNAVADFYSKYKACLTKSSIPGSEMYLYLKPKRIQLGDLLLLQNYGLSPGTEASIDMQKRLNELSKMIWQWVRRFTSFVKYVAEQEYLLLFLQGLEVCMPWLTLPSHFPLSTPSPRAGMRWYLSS
jgi:hypothetical protein